MKLYLTAAGRYVGTQAEAKAAGKGWRPENVPTDKPGLIDYLNAHAGAPSVATPAPINEAAGHAHKGPCAPKVTARQCLTCQARGAAVNAAVERAEVISVSADRISDALDCMAPDELAPVAAAVARRFARLGK